MRRLRQLPRVDWPARLQEIGFHYHSIDERGDAQPPDALMFRYCREDAAYVQFGDGSWLCFDLVADPTWRTTVDDPAVVLPLAQEMLTWRSEHADRTLTDMVLTRGGIGRWPVLPDGWGEAEPATAGTQDGTP